MQHWSIREAKDQLSRLIDAAQSAPQAITRRGRDAVVVVSKREYERLLRRREPLTEFFTRGLRGVSVERTEAVMRDEGEL